MFRSTRRLTQLIAFQNNHLEVKSWKRLIYNFREQTEYSTSHILHQRRWSSIDATAKDHSHMIHKSDCPLLDITIGQLFQESVEKWPNREFIISLHQNVRITYSEFLKRADRLAAGFRKIGLRKGDRLAIWGPNDLEWFLTAVAAFRSGLIVVGVNPNYVLDEIRYCLQKVGVKAVVSPTEFKSQKYPEILLAIKKDCPGLEHVIIYSQDHVRGTRRFADVESLANAAETEAIAASQGEISCHDGCNIQFTSGTTGRPKAPLLSHRSVLNNSRQVTQRGELDVDSNRICLNVPFFHAFGQLAGQMAVIHSGSTLVLEARSFNPIASMDAIAREKCNVLYGTPTMWVHMLQAQQKMQVPMDIRIGFIGGSPASPELFSRIFDILGVKRMKHIYGLTEVTGVTFQSLPEEDIELTINTVGHLSDHVEVKVVGEDGSPVPFNTPGELYVRGYSLMKCYWDDEENTKKTITEDGWLKTGDQFILRPNGYGNIVGRIKDMIIRGGENIFPKEIEDFLLTHPYIQEVQVIGVHDDVYGEEICACIRLYEGKKLTGEEVKNFCREKIARFKIPRYIAFVDEYPKTTSGKVQKFKLKEELERKGIIPRKQ